MERHQAVGVRCACLCFQLFIYLNLETKNQHSINIFILQAANHCKRNYCILNP